MTTGRVAVNVQGITKSFDEKSVHRDLSLELYSGELIAILGGSGEGKSVLLKMIIGLVHPDSGHIFFRGKDIAAMSEQELYFVRRDIGYVFQDGALFDSLTVEENLAYPLKLHGDWTEARIRSDISERLKMLDLEGTNSLYPDELSGGMKKRVGLLRATMLRPEIILLDEPTAGLDPIHVALFAQGVERIKITRGFTGLFVTHDIACAFAISDRVALLHGGMIHAIGTPDYFRQSKDPLIRAFLTPQYHWNPEAA